MSAMGSELGCRSLAASLGTAGECISKPERRERTREGLSLPRGRGGAQWSLLHLGV